MSSNGSNDKNDRSGGEGLARSVSAVEEVSRKRLFKSLAQDVSYTYSRGNNNIMGRTGSRDEDQINESIPKGLENMVRRMVSTATQDLQNRIDTIQNENKEKMVSMQTEIDDLTKRNQELENAVKDLTLKNEYNEWSYTAEEIPDSYWISRGFSEDYAKRIKRLLSKMKEYTHQLRRGESRVMILSFGINDHMLHDDIILPHWKEFADALVHYQNFEYRKNYGLRCFGIRNVQLQQEVIDMLAPVLNTATGIKNIQFGRLDITSEVISFVADIIEHNSYIQGISWHSNQIESMDDMRRFCKSIRKSVGNSLKSLGLNNCFNGNNQEMMRIVVDATSQLEELNMNNNGIGSVSATFIANFLASNPPMKHLDLTGNNLNDTDATLLANALQSNTNLKQLYLANNNITAIGRKVLLESVFNVTSLNSCAASNHSCSILVLTPDISDINMYEEPPIIRAMKIFAMLSATNEGFFNTNYLGDVSYKLIPDVLRLTQDFTRRTPELSEAYFEQTGQRCADWDQLDVDTVPITSMFELLRGWAVPSLS